MTNRKALLVRATLLISLTIYLTLLSTRLQADTQTTGSCSGATWHDPSRRHEQSLRGVQ